MRRLITLLALITLIGCSTTTAQHMIPEPSDVGWGWGRGFGHWTDAFEIAAMEEGSFDNVPLRVVAYPVMVPVHILGGFAEGAYLGGCAFFTMRRCGPWVENQPNRLVVEKWQ